MFQRRDTIELLQSQIIPILGTLFVALISFIGISIRNVYKKYVNTQLKKEIVDTTVNYIEQISKTILMGSEEKFSQAKDKALTWLEEKGISISEEELELLIESAVNQLNQELKQITG